MSDIPDSVFCFDIWNLKLIFFYTFDNVLQVLTYRLLLYLVCVDLFCSHMTRSLEAKYIVLLF